MPTGATVLLVAAAPTPEPVDNPTSKPVDNPTGGHQSPLPRQTAGEVARMFSRIKTLLKLVLNC